MQQQEQQQEQHQEQQEQQEQQQEEQQQQQQQQQQQPENQLNAILTGHLQSIFQDMSQTLSEEAEELADNYIHLIGQTQSETTTLNARTIELRDKMSAVVRDMQPPTFCNTSSPVQQQHRYATSEQAEESEVAGAV